MTIPGSANPLLLKSAAAAGGYQIERSLRFNSSDSAFCGRVPASAGNRTTWTFSTWIKRSKLGVLQRFFTGATATNDNDWTAILFNASDQLVIGGYNIFFRTSNSVYRDCSAWYHLVVLADLGNGTNSLKLRAWINNEEVAWSSTSSNPTTTGINAANNHAIGAEQSPNNGGVGSYFDGYLADIHFIDGQALTPSSFTEVSATTGQLIPKAYTGTFTGNSFWLKFSDNSSTTSGSNVGIGKDFSGLGNYWNSTNLSVTAGADNDSLVDTPTSYGTDTGAGGGVRGNYATLNPLDGSPAGLSNGNLDASSANAYPTIIPGSGSWYYEVNGTGYSWDGTRSNWTPRAGSHNFGQRAFSSTAPSGFKALCDTNLTSTTITTSGSYTGNGTADGPFVYLNGVPTAMTIGGNAVTFGTHADKLSNGFKIRTSSTTYNQNASSYSYSITSTGAAFKNARAQPNP